MAEVLYAVTEITNRVVKNVKALRYVFIIKFVIDVRIVEVKVYVNTIDLLTLVKNVIVWVICKI